MDSQTDRQTDRQIDRQDRQDRQADKTDRQADRQIDRQMGIKQYQYYIDHSDRSNVYDWFVVLEIVEVQGKSLFRLAVFD